MRSLCLAALLKAEDLAEEEATELILRHFAACSLESGDDDQEQQVG